MKLGNGRWETAKFNTRLQVEELGLGSSAANAGLWKAGYEYGELDQNGNLNASKNTGNIARQTLTVPGSGFVQSYKYDALYRLKEAKENAGSAAGAQNWIQNFDYDRYGNRTFFSQTVGGTASSGTPAVVAATNRFVEGPTLDYS